VVARINFRGVGASEGVHDHGKGETDDMAMLHAWMTGKFPGLPVALSGFSFGTYVQSHCAQRLAAAGTPAERLVLVGSAPEMAMADIPADTILIHGETTTPSPDRRAGLAAPAGHPRDRSRRRPLLPPQARPHQELGHAAVTPASGLEPRLNRRRL
jgi:alpha/beta superfamily hydrolase